MSFEEKHPGLKERAVCAIYREPVSVNEAVELIDCYTSYWIHETQVDKQKIREAIQVLKKASTPEPDQSDILLCQGAITALELLEKRLEL